jgi:hypothetical protein
MVRKIYQAEKSQRDGRSMIEHHSGAYCGVGNNKEKPAHRVEL